MSLNNDNNVAETNRTARKLKQEKHALRFTLHELFNKKTLVSYIEAAQTKKLIEEE